MIAREPLAVRTALVAFVTALVHLLVLLDIIELDTATETALVTTVDLAAALAIVLLVRPKVTPIEAPMLTAEQLSNSPAHDADAVFGSSGEIDAPGPDHRD